MQIRRGQLYYLKEKPSTGGGLASGDPKARPVLVVSIDPLNGGHSVILVPFYSRQLDKRQSQAWCAVFSKGEGGLLKDCVAKCDEIFIYEKSGIDLQHGPIGAFDEAQMDRVMTAVKWAIGINS